MTPTEREELKRRIDARIRQLLADSPPRERICVGCGGEYDHVTIGCRQCSERRIRRRLRRTLSYKASQAEYMRAYRERKRNAA